MFHKEAAVCGILQWSNADQDICSKGGTSGYFHGFAADCTRAKPSIALLILALSCLGLITLFSPVMGGMIIRGQCFIDGAPAPDGLDVRFKSNESGIYRDFTDFSKVHKTRNGYYEGEALVDSPSTFDRDGFKDADIIFVFINGQVAKASVIGSSPLTFPFYNNTIDNSPNAYVTNDAPEPASSFKSTLMPQGRVNLTWLASPSEDASKYLIYWDNGTGTIDYTTPWVSLDHPQSSYVTPELPNGVLFYFHLKTMDTLGKIEHNRLNIQSAFPDSVKPQATITSPTYLQEVNGDFEITGIATDQYFKEYILEYGISVSPTSWELSGTKSFVPINGSRLQVIDTRGLKDGIYSLKLTVTDFAGNVSSHIMPFYLRKLATSITSPRSFEILRGNVTVTGTSTDPSFSAYRLDYGRGEIPSTWYRVTRSTAQVTNTILGVWNTEGLDGPYSLRLVIEKNDGSEELRGQILAFVENNAPPLYITYPQQDLRTNTSTLSITGVTDPNATLKVDGVTIELASNSSGFTHTVTLSEGTNTFNFSVADRSGNIALTTIRTVLDTQAPLLTVTAPIDNFTTTRPVAAVTGKTEAGALLTIDGVAVNVEADGSFATDVILTDSQNTIELISTDRAGNRTRASKVVIFSLPVDDKLPPEIALVAPADKSLVALARPPVIIEIADDKSGVNQTLVTITVDDRPVGTSVQKLSSQSVRITYTPSTNLADGLHRIHVFAVDNNGNQSTMDATFTTDTTPPPMEVGLLVDPSDPGRVIIHVIPGEELSSVPGCMTWMLNHEEAFDESLPSYMTELTPAAWKKGNIACYEGSIKINSFFNSKLVVRITGKDAAGLFSTVQQAISSLNSDGNSGFELTNHGSALLSIPQTSLAGAGKYSLFTEDLSDITAILTRDRKLTDQGLLKIATGITIALPSANFNGDVRLAINYPDSNRDGFVDTVSELPIQRLGIYTIDSTGNFILSGNELMISAQQVRTSTLSGGTHFLLADTTPPVIRVLRTPLERESTNPKILYTVADSGSGMDWSAVTFQLNGLSSPFNLDISTGTVTFYPRNPLMADTTYTVTLMASDRAGNMSYSAMNFTTASGLEIRSLASYPNPARRAPIRIRYELSRNADSVMIRVYDTGGDLIFDAPADTLGGINEFLWNLEDNAGRGLPNDIYFYKVTATLDDGTKVEKTSKIAVLR
ncbi:MAG: hypothetical protein CVV64_02170 [Candidatus Wallbacteria bacterium HGW-Wallbacteria-1]|jgi:hypothetical protein|uniref:SbsA Ig-like domain-containing protein n=1 Tax=Candidatus Wallbacteria bacterium HGW-Wallbacteria-1 TaxID=2013854 RepID=A0A2N1PV67_9BACT|nr:MAG: hypothetical protein CVV64_02170 [Candidatus Wallbacteria bacterium HGW-Wallbacteria-1]